jgi:pilus assembly protein CpaD
MDSSWTDVRRKETVMQLVPTEFAESRGIARLVVRAAIVGGCSIFLCCCNTDQQVAAVPDVPTDYRLRHPITMTETTQTLDVFVGSNRGELNATQRAEVLAFAQRWRHEATGGVVVNLPVGTNNERAAAEAARGIHSILAASGVPPDGIVVRGYQPPGRNIAAIRITYPKIGAQAGPCGLWPEDIGPSLNRDHFENQPIYNAGCATQRNLAAMVDNPADLVQPRSETPAYTARRTTVVEKYRAGTTAATQYPSMDAAKISDIGK